MSEVVIRRAEKADLPAIVAMLADDALGRAREKASMPLAQAYLDAFAAIDANQTQFLAVMTDGDDVIGTLQISFLPGLSLQGAWRGQIEAVRIAANRRGERLGQRLLEWAVERCRERGCKVVQLTTNKSRLDAHRFYERLGFKASHIGYKLEL
ncbi:GNAT family N-acetyltransferase [Mesorhizobium sp. M1C.F.Ca.ET.193.01.1.1]|uniref:GNAT family N-acetyltransferase n=1 Tax=unclassified Mesorhizobium TaxID=325217 RepID=UPI000FD57065|nr:MULTISPECIES: GNAT family N-acetyltransferase [unclassified Mesorhizobium]TGT04573.1 GNAT family N-acetyltransferase [bacterium M00.F.Ca.ET.177.01.1.1]TGQ57402.1 GNAT family N-acetyltransferase [Mesorhizobium sp. M1C.F.Ca.ET.210.01.1.1]TGQ75859.1 GNAT family N-acetyltransferase [Mesorhizobium sp. M1C.F.Ca.ET.212.01.1.1]TGR14242.1 GNAT family N-acetyltransferase [Mesorhizobium sp. M1C.F.Ca.ET.204.01.1.1]TGR35404.1 GNAT family N-acetyltransferase [Mesorhizobium sp. M1C.F.Ca.ET.196.01.1.1]